MIQDLIQNVSDTALWVAFYRAMESERPDALFRDPYARRLAGEQGEKIVRHMKGGKGSAWAMIVRTSLLDEMIGRAIARDGVDLVINLAAGLDTRPYRLPLPPALRWVEVDLAPLLDYKESILAGEKPVCDLERVRLDLTDGAGRRALFARLGAAAKKVLVITEGLLVYLPEAEVASLAADLHTPPSFHDWLLDLASPWLLQYLKRTWSKQLANAPFLFGPAAGVEFFRPHGWQAVEELYMWEEGERLGRQPPFSPLFRILGLLMPKAKRETMRKASSVLRLGRI